MGLGSALGSLRLGLAIRQDGPGFPLRYGCCADDWMRAEWGGCGSARDMVLYAARACGGAALSAGMVALSQRMGPGRSEASASLLLSAR